MKEAIIDYLLEHANPSIVLRVKKEVLHAITESEEARLIEAILSDKHVMIAVQAQKPNGWIGESFHGSANRFDNMEVGLRFLAEKGLPFDHGVIKKAVRALAQTNKNSPAYGMSKFLQSPENDYAYTASGVYLARSSIALRAGYEYRLSKQEDMNLPYDIEHALQCFRNVLQTEKPDDVVYRRRGKLCFVEGTLWPCIYHLRILAHSHGWRSKETTDALNTSIQKLYDWPQNGEFVYTYMNGQLKGPCMAFIHTPVNETLSSGVVGGMFFDRLELFARCGAVYAVEPLRNEYTALLSLIKDDLTLDMDVNNTYALGWSPYFGFALEEDWRSRVRKQCDVLFRILLILHYTEQTR